MNNTIVNNQQYSTQEENKQTSFFSRGFSIFGISIPYWLISLCLIIIIILIFFVMPDDSTKAYTKIYPDYDFSIATDSPTNTAIDNILNRRY